MITEQLSHAQILVACAHHLALSSSIKVFPKGFEHSLEIPHDHYLSMKPFLRFSFPRHFMFLHPTTHKNFTTSYDSYYNTQKKYQQQAAKSECRHKKYSGPQKVTGHLAPPHKLHFPCISKSFSIILFAVSNIMHVYLYLLKV